MFQQGFFQIDPNLGPDEVKKRRERLSDMVRGGYGSAQSVPEGITHLVAGFLENKKRKGLDEVERTGREGASDIFGKLVGGRSAPQPGPMSIGGIPPVQARDINSPQAVAGDTMAALGKDPAANIRTGLIQRGLPEHIADGFVMNFRDESGLDSGINETAPIVPGSRGGFGLAQWTGPRRKALEAFASERGAPVSDVDTQLDFLMTELQGPESSAAREIFAAGDAGGAAAAIVNKFLRPAEQHRAHRAAQYTGGQQQRQPAPQDNVAQLYAALENPWLTQPQRTAVMGMIQQAQNAPAQALDMELKQLQLDQARNPQAKPTDDIREYQFAQGQGFDGSFQDFMTANRKAGASNSNITVMPNGGGLPGLGKLPAGQTYLYDDNGKVQLDGRGVPKVVTLTPESEQAAADTKNLNRVTQRRRSGGTVVQDLQRGLDLVEDLSPVSSMDGVIGATGRLASTLIPGTAANRIQQFTESALSNVGLDVLQQMRDNSPTGGALGQVPIQQQKRLEQVLGSLRIDQDIGDLKANMQRVMNIYTDIMYGAAEEREAAVAAGDLSEEENASIEEFYFDLPFDDRGKPVGVPSPPQATFEAFSKDSSAIAAAEKYGVTLEEMWAIKQGQK